MADDEPKKRAETASAPEPTQPRPRTGGGRGRRFEKGNKAGVGHGRPRRDAIIDEFFDEVLKAPDGTAIERRWALLQRLYASAMDVRRKDHPRLVELCTAYAFGKPRERVEMSGPGGGPITSADATPSRRGKTTGELRKEMDALWAKREAFLAKKAAAAGQANGATGGEAAPPGDPEPEET